MSLLGGLLDFITGSDSDTKQSVSTTKNENVSTSSIKGSVGASGKKTGSVTAGETSSAASQDTVTRLLSEIATGQLEGLLTGLISGKTGSDNTANLETISNLLTSRVEGGDQSTEESIRAIVDRARTTGTRALNSQITGVATNIGSSMNTITKQLAAQGSADLEGSLANAEGQLRLQAREAGTNELINSLKAIGDTQSSGVKDIAAIADVLKGAVGTATVSGESEQAVKSESQTTEQLMQQVTEILEALSSGNTYQSSSGSSETNQSGSLLDVLKVLMS
jgi:hypothetical protein